MNSTFEIIQYYQRSIDDIQKNGPRLLHCINQLNKLPIQGKHLQETGIDKTVDSLQKFNDEIQVAVKCLAKKCKASAKEDPMDPTSQKDGSEAHSRYRDDVGVTTEHDESENDENHNPINTTQKQKRSKHHSSSDAHKEQKQKVLLHIFARSSKTLFLPDEEHKLSLSSTKATKGLHRSSTHANKKRRKHKSDQKDRKHGKREEPSNAMKWMDSSDDIHASSHPISYDEISNTTTKHIDSSEENGRCVKDTGSSASEFSNKDTDNSVRKRRYNSDNESNDSLFPRPKVAKIERISKTGFSSQATADAASIPSNDVNTTILSVYSTPSIPELPLKEPKAFSPAALPTIYTNYKPVATLFDFSSSFSSFRPVHTLSDDQVFASKTVRTKVFSGVRKGKIGQVPTLGNMCTRILQKNIDGLRYTGGVPFEVLRPVLERATPQQLHTFEQHNHYITEGSDILWQQHVSLKYRTEKRLENESWREMFSRCQEKEERRLMALKESIKASKKTTSAFPVRKVQLAFADSTVKPPPKVLMKQQQCKAKVVVAPATASLSEKIPNISKPKDQKAKVNACKRSSKKAPLMQKTLRDIRCLYK